MGLFLNIGCGNIRYKGVVNIDITESDMVDADVVADMRRLPYNTGEVDGIIANHVLEHIPTIDHIVAILEWYRVLKVGGKLLIGVPNLEEVCKAFLENREGRRQYFYHCIYGRCLYPGDGHQSGFTQDSLTDLLLMNGFGNLQWSFYDINMQVIARRSETLPTNRLGKQSCEEIQTWQV